MTTKLLLESPPVLVPNWPAPASIHAVVTTRTGGVSEAPYHSLNLGKHVGDAPDKVSENCARVRHLIPNEPIWLEQVHGTRAWDSGEYYQADAANSA